MLCVNPYLDPDDGHHIWNHVVYVSGSPYRIKDNNKKQHASSIDIHPQRACFRDRTTVVTEKRN
jgi:hypothetical protein